MDGIRFINTSNIPGMKKIAPPKPFTKGGEPTQIKDGVVSGYYSGPEVLDPRKAFDFGKPEVSQPVSENVKPEEMTTEQYFLSGASDQYKNFGLNGPNSPQSGIETVSGLKLGQSNPKFLIME